MVRGMVKVGTFLTRCSDIIWMSNSWFTRKITILETCFEGYIFKKSAGSLDNGYCVWMGTNRRVLLFLNDRLIGENANYNNNMKFKKKNKYFLPTTTVLKRSQSQSIAIIISKWGKNLRKFIKFFLGKNWFKMRKML